MTHALIVDIDSLCVSGFPEAEISFYRFEVAV
jgi:hypothetical protein